jgi:flavin-dependent dehydrogenase
MKSAEVIIVGGGPAGSSCAWRLKRQGVDCLVLDKEPFPRTKLCAGWITPEVVDDLELDIASYPHRFLSFQKLHFHFRLFAASPLTMQHSIRRYEFDAWLLERSKAPVETHKVQSIRQQGEEYVIDDRYRCRYLIGAGGTRCPVYRALFRGVSPRASKKQVVALEEEFRYDYSNEKCHLWFFDRELPGYAWYVPKADGYINIGIGAMADKLKTRGGDIKSHWNHLTRKLQRKRLISGHDFNPKGYSYYVRGKAEVFRSGNAFIAGDAAGLATKDMAEGIGPAVKSGLMAANSIVSGTPYDLSTISSKSFDARKLMLSWLFHRPYTSA